MKYLSLSRSDLNVCAAIAILAGCSSPLGMPSTQAVGFAQHPSRVSRPSNLGLVIPPSVGPENINGNERGGEECGPSIMGFEMSVNVSGNATGPYPGTFVGSAKAEVTCRLRGSTNISGAFTITSGSKVINGNFSGDGTYGCFRGCYAEAGSAVTYTATLTHGGKVRKQFSGYVSGTIGNAPNFVETMDITLKGL